MSDQNTVILVGRLGQDAEVKETRTGKSVANLSVATSSSGRDGQERTSWHRVVAWQQLAEQCKPLRKGARIGVIGELRSRSYEARDGGKRYVTEVVANVIMADAPRERPRPQSQESLPMNNGGSFDDDEIPF